MGMTIQILASLGLCLSLGVLYGLLVRHWVRKELQENRIIRLPGPPGPTGMTGRCPCQDNKNKACGGE